MMQPFAAPALLLAALLGGVPAAPTPPRDGGLLSPGKPSTGSLAPGQAVVFTIPASEGQFLHVEVDQVCLPLTARLTGPGGRGDVEAANPVGEDEPLTLAALTDSGGAWHLMLRLEPSSAASGRYRIRLAEPRPAGPEDEKLIAAERAYAEGQRQLAEGTAESLRQAVASNELAARLAGQAGDRRREAWAHKSGADARWAGGAIDQAVAEVRLALELFRALGDAKGIIESINDRGVFELEGGNPQYMIDAGPEALALAVREGDRYNESVLLNDLGSAFFLLGDFERARDYLDRALVVKRTLGNLRNEAYTLEMLGMVATDQQDYRGALRYHQRALEIRRALADRRGEALTLAHLGWAYQGLSRHGDALRLLRQARELDRATGHRLEESISTDGIGESLLALGQTEEALEEHERALGIARELGNGLRQARSLGHLATALRKAGRLDEARRAAAQAVELLEATRAGVFGSGNRTSFSAGVRRFYALLADILSGLAARSPQTGLEAQALEVSERSRARGLLELLAEAKVDLRQGVEPSLLAEEGRLAQAIEAASARQASLAAADQRQVAESAEPERALAALSRDLAEVRDRIRAASPRYAALTLAQPPDVAAIQRELGADSLLLEYFLGETESLLWAVGADGLTMHRLPGRTTVEEAVRQLWLAWSSGAPPSEERRRATRASAMLLGPVAARLGDRRLVVVADGALHYLPFAALPIPGRAERLITAHEVVTVPSAAALAALRVQAAGRTPAPLALAILADPVFEARDPRVRAGAPRAGAATSVFLQHSSQDVGLAGFERLRSSREEAQAIAALVPPGQAALALDFQASRATTLGPEVARSRVVHFATHGLLDSRSPDLSGLVLSLVDEAGQPQNGFLRAGDLYQLSLGADLVVLSACQTALGKEIRGEGLLGLTRGFMYAGAPRVVASLWQVPDRATAELMQRFYAGMLRDGLTASAALRRAQVSMLADPRWSRPHAWAGFSLQGDWR
jgi:CHAT domain-containing protein